MTTALLVANGGGHVRQMAALWPRIAEVRDATRVWVTFDELASHALVGDDELVAAFQPTSRNIPNTLRNVRLAWSLIRSRHFDIAVSSGAALAVPFLTIASRRGVPSHYIESAARAEGPSLSGRMVARLGRVSLYTQHARWADDTWTYAGSVFDGYGAVAKAGSRVGRVLVSLGSTDLRFDRLINRLLAIIPDGVAVHWQIGKTPPPPQRPGWESSTYLSGDEFAAELRKADVIVTHSGTGSALSALENGLCPVLVPRASGTEAVDDHQVELARFLADLGLAVHADADALTFEDLRRAAGFAVERRLGPDIVLKPYSGYLLLRMFSRDHLRGERTKARKRRVCALRFAALSSAEKGPLPART